MEKFLQLQLTKENEEKVKGDVKEILCKLKKYIGIFKMWCSLCGFREVIVSGITVEGDLHVSIGHRAALEKKAISTIHDVERKEFATTMNPYVQFQFGDERNVSLLDVVMQKGFIHTLDTDKNRNAIVSLFSYYFPNSEIGAFMSEKEDRWYFLSMNDIYVPISDIACMYRKMELENIVHKNISNLLNPEV